MSIFQQGGFSAAARFHAAAWIVFLSMAHTEPGRAEAGEQFVPDPPAPVVLPVALGDDGPAVGAVTVRRDPPGMEAARGARWAEALAKPRRPSLLVKPPAPALADEPAAAPAMSLIARANAAELAKDGVPQASAWRRWLGSPYTAWIAAVLLIGVPLVGVLRRSMTGWREARGWAEYD